MTISPLPSRGDVLVGQDVTGRWLRVSPHPSSGRVVLSIWQDSTCVATVRLAEGDVPDLVRVLTTAIGPQTQDEADQHDGPTANVLDLNAPAAG